MVKSEPVKEATQLLLGERRYWNFTTRLGRSVKLSGGYHSTIFGGGRFRAFNLGERVRGAKLFDSFGISKKFYHEYNGCKPYTVAVYPEGVVMYFPCGDANLKNMPPIVLAPEDCRKYAINAAEKIIQFRDKYISKAPKRQAVEKLATPKPVYRPSVKEPLVKKEKKIEMPEEKKTVSTSVAEKVKPLFEPPSLEVLKAISKLPAKKPEGQEVKVNAEEIPRKAERLEPVGRVKESMSFPREEHDRNLPISKSGINYRIGDNIFVGEQIFPERPKPDLTVESTTGRTGSSLNNLFITLRYNVKDSKS